jgi:predicted RNase H-like HicB family nuclease
MRMPAKAPRMILVLLNMDSSLPKFNERFLNSNSVVRNPIHGCGIIRYHPEPKTNFLQKQFCYNCFVERQDEMKFTVEYEREEDGRWLAEVKELPGVLTYGKDPDDAVAHAQALALRVIADRLENGEAISALMFSFSAA